MASLSHSAAQTTSYQVAERRTLEDLRARYRQNHGLWSDRTLAHLRFLRWLVHTGRLVS